MYRTFNLSQIIALHRATPFLTGIGLAIFLKDFKKPNLPKGVVTTGWIATFIGFFWCFFTPSNLSQKDYIYDPISAAQYSAIAPLMFSICLSWIIFACYIDSECTANNILCSRVAKVLGRICFSIYLNVFLILFYFNGTVKSAEEFQISSFIDRVEFFFIFLISFAFAILIDQPTKNIMKLFENRDSLSTEIIESNESEEKDDDFDDPFADRDDDFVFRSRKTSNYAELEEDKHENGLNW